MEPESFLKNTKNNTMLVLCMCMNDYHGTPKFLQQHRPFTVASTVTSPKYVTLERRGAIYTTEG
ncbi:unnamed protein product [Fusarium venenatum]|uniref:Uncharacterized protein n=1 Tax=Fusarium venenatum TaxID=56646 RepID=A0A2L2U3Z1_9HYPO|nr:LOW QUALITY PROTEIN: uncharacterized protein FVRRES_09722 [Fusarium venenatum]CEI69645.1 unnamed protein product [Fusarium venenatum]